MSRLYTVKVYCLQPTRNGKVQGMFREGSRKVQHSFRQVVNNRFSPVLARDTCGMSPNQDPLRNVADDLEDKLPTWFGVAEPTSAAPKSPRARLGSTGELWNSITSRNILVQAAGWHHC